MHAFGSDTGRTAERRCEDCLRMGDTWFRLRGCLSCGYVGCCDSSKCDSSKNKHATKHFHGSGHPLVKSFQPGENWMWCYVDEVVMEAQGRNRAGR